MVVAAVVVFDDVAGVPVAWLLMGADTRLGFLRATGPLGLLSVSYNERSQAKMLLEKTLNNGSNTNVILRTNNRQFSALTCSRVLSDLFTVSSSLLPPSVDSVAVDWFVAAWTGETKTSSDAVVDR